MPIARKPVLAMASGKRNPNVVPSIALSPLLPHLDRAPGSEPGGYILGFSERAALAGLALKSLPKNESKHNGDRS